MDRKTSRYLINILRQATIAWAGRTEALKNSRELHKEASGRLKYYWKCNACKCWKRDVSEVQVDHIIEVGPFTGDWTDYINRLFCSVSNLQVLCLSCHLNKTSSFNASRRFKRKVYGN